MILALLLFAGFSPGVASAAVDPVGRVISASGEVTAVRAGESARSLARGEAVYEGDEIRTGEHGNTQIRFDDGGLFDLDPETRFAVDRYRVEDDGGGSAVMSFLRGALRTITGSIGSSSGGTYRLGTPTATLGVRGTAYALSYCDAACAQDHGGQPGLYGRVDDGTVRVRTARGNADQRAGQFFFVPEGGTPRVILKPPSGILDQGDSETGEQTRSAIEEAVAAMVAQAVTNGGPFVLGTPGTVFESGDLFESVGEITGVGAAGAASAGFLRGAGYLNAQTFDQRGPFQANDQVQMTGASLDSAMLFGFSAFDIGLNGATLAESDVMPDLSVGWGRWEGGLTHTSTTNSLGATTGNLAYTITNNLTLPTRLASLAGTLNYNLAGGPSAFDTSGDLWRVNTLSLNVTFDGQPEVGLNRFILSSRGDVVRFLRGDGSPVDIDIAGNRFQLPLLNDNQDTGAIAGRFVGVNGEGAIVVFGIERNEDRDKIVGTKVLRKQ